ncbi:Helix-turn-helix [Pedobacter westerhofensis]|uniref:Helix-turn-helix n=1 Tax=Pedobacter westerhofensis TaxID=425512 RepID=A0A521FQE9_9SPHI|nr:helix-turn-helix transcriptional regulator [Pedobacter westerhofensis]SMO98304.1 Helix-turn-helix [Pedobacter westerhofensis]
MDSLQLKLGARIKMMREKNGYSIRSFALIADMEHPQLINIEKGRVDLRLSTMKKIADALVIEVDELLRFND